MKSELAQLLVCSMCKGGLSLRVDDENAEEVVAGLFTCQKCGTTYPIEDTIPNMLPPDMR
ncbi:MAG: methytransferase partner Trm112 [Dehalococcoidia bacterium]|nr:methytransferase partner Trm112 [Dehalococcoidia bacterium]